MEHRLLYFAVNTEQQEKAETHQAEKDPDENMKQAAEDYARSDLEAEKGGHALVHRAEEIRDSKDTPAFTQALMDKGVKNIQHLAGERKRNLTPEATKKLNDAINDLKNKIKTFEKRKLDNAAAEAEIKKLSTVPGADKILEGLKISFQSKSKGGTVEFEWKPNNPEGVSQLGLEQKKLLAKAMHERIASNSVEGEGDKAIESLRDSLLSNSEVPKSHKEWLRHPEKGFDGATEKQKTLGYVVEWIMKNLGELTTQSAKFKLIASQTEANPQAAKQLSEKGVKISTENFRELSRTERNDVLKNYANVLASADADLAKRAAEAGVSDAAESGGIQVENTAAIERAEAETTAQAKDLAPKLQDFALKKNLAAKTATLQRELEEAGKEAGTVENVANLRQQAQEGKSEGFGAKLKKLFGRGEKATADDYFTNAASEKPGEIKEEDLAARARREVAGETLDDPNNLKDLQAELGLKGVQKDEAAQLATLLANEKIDAETIRGQLTPEMKALLERRKADDYEASVAA